MNMNLNNNSRLPEEVKEALNQESPDTHRELENAWDLIGISQPAAQPSSLDEKAEMWARMKQRIDGNIETPAANVKMQQSMRKSTSEDRRPVRRSTLRLVKSTRWLAMAASFAIIFLSGVLYWKTPVTVTALPGQVAQVSLPDGSTVELNSGATLEYVRGFKSLPFTGIDARQVKLEGEAYFTVTKSTVPFTVETFNATVGVLGTQFNVRAWPSQSTNTAVTLATGRVEVSSLDQSDHRVLLSNPGDHVEIASDLPLPVAPINTNINTVVIWRDGGFAVNNESLKSVFAELERRFDTQIVVQDQATLNDQLTVMMANPGTIETILDDICTQKDLNYRRTSRGYEVY